MPNYLLGHGEKLVEPIAAPRGRGGGAVVYTLEEVKEALVPQATAVTGFLDHLPKLACPEDQAVIDFTMHPKFLAMSYFPATLLRYYNLRVVGSREARVSPRKLGRKKKYPEEGGVAPCYFVAGSRSAFREFSNSLPDLQPKTQSLENELGRIEYIKPLDESRIKAISGDDEVLPVEIVLHAHAGIDDYVLNGFVSYANTFDIGVDLEKKLSFGGLSFLSLRTPRKHLSDLLKFSFVRVIRRMPKLRFDADPFRTTSIPKNFSVKLPTEKAINGEIRTAVFDGGVANVKDLAPWVRSRLPAKIGPAAQDLILHGVGVTSAALFGPIKKDHSIPRPFSNIDHWQVVDNQDLISDDDDLHEIIRRIDEILMQHQYDFINLSVGPNLAVEDDEVHPWTAMLDMHLARGDTLATVAIGNNGDKPKWAQLNRIQPPGDSVNAIAVGAADAVDGPWRKTVYSPVGPGRSPGLVKPDVMAFGGTLDQPFFLLDANNPGMSRGTTGTSFAAPTVLHLATGIRATLGSAVDSLAVKAILLHHASRKNEHSINEAGWGRVPDQVSYFITSKNHEAHILYRGVLPRGDYLRAPVPMPSGQIAGMVEIKATFCYACPVDPGHPLNYTRSGLEITFRKNTRDSLPIDKKTGKIKSTHDSTSFFGKSILDGLTEEELRKEVWKWETARTSKKKFLGRTLNAPVFDIHYLAREESQNLSESEVFEPLSYALMITVSAPKVPDLYNRVVQRYRGILEILQPTIEIPIQV